MSARSIRLLPAALAVLFWVPVASAQEAPPPSPKPPTVSVVAAEDRELVATAIVTGTLVPRETVVIAAEVEGLQLRELLADEGDSVEAGAVLARLSTDTIEIELARNESEIARADAAIAQAGSQISEAEATAIEANAALERTRPLQASGVVGRDVLDQRVAAASAAQARLSSAQQGLAVANADKALTLAARRELELRQSQAEIRAPTAGLILSRAARLGSTVSMAAGPLFEMARDGLIELEGNVGETTLNGLRQGQSVAVIPAGGTERLDGRIRLVSPSVDQATRLGRVRIELPPSTLLKSGMFARGIVELGRSTGVVVPRTSVVDGADGASVQVVVEGRIETRSVELGIATSAEVEITDGLAAGEEVVALAGTFVRDGDAVTPVALAQAEIEG